MDLGEEEDDDGEGRRVELEGLQVNSKRRRGRRIVSIGGVEEVPELFLGRELFGD